MWIPGENTPYDAVHLQIHTGSDHSLNGTYFGADLQLFHKQVGKDRYAMLGIFLEPENSGSLPLSNILTEWELIEAVVNEQCSLPVNVPEDRNSASVFSVYDLVPDEASIYAYDGSLTAPPCTENVLWNVVDQPAWISNDDFLRLAGLIIDYVDPSTCQKATAATPDGLTSRPVQGINDRNITRFCPVSMAVIEDDYFFENSTGNEILNSTSNSTWNETDGDDDDWEDLYPALPAYLPKPFTLLSMFSSYVLLREVVFDQRHNRGKPISRVLLSMSVADIIFSFAYFLGTWPAPPDTLYIWKENTGSQGFCTFQAVLFQFGLMASPFFNVLLAVFYLMIIRYRWTDSQLRKSEPWAHGSIWSVSLVLALFPIP
jgi:carbonic anhydrase